MRFILLQTGFYILSMYVTEMICHNLMMSRVN